MHTHAHAHMHVKMPVRTQMRVIRAYELSGRADELDRVAAKMQDFQRRVAALHQVRPTYYHPPRRAPCAKAH